MKRDHSGGKKGRTLRIVQGDVQEGAPRVSVQTLEAYFAFLQKNLTFPFQGTFVHETGLFQTTLRHLTVLQLRSDIDEFYGLFVEGKAGKKNVVIPLADFDCKRTDKRNHRLIEGYKTWF
jgi:hypothetical protein